jgi:DNA-directed RNA polymerase specialized sigma24 family protein
MLHVIPTGSVTGNLRRAQSGDHVAFEWLWRRYYQSLIRHLKKRTDGPGFETSVFISLHQGLSEEKFHSLHGRYQLWKLLTLIGLRKAINQARKNMLDQRSIEHSAISGYSVIDLRLSTKACATQVDKSFDGLRFEEELEHGLRLLDKEHPNQRLRELAVLKINGMSNAKIAEEFRWSRKTVALRLNLIFEIWREASEA